MGVPGSSDPAGLIELQRDPVADSGSPAAQALFAEGRRSLHRVSPVEGPVPRSVAFLAYDAKPDADSHELFELVRYGRSQPVA